MIVIVIVCGGRDYRGRAFLFSYLDGLHALLPFTLLRHGDARGADTLASQWARSRGVAEDPHPALWYPRPGKLDRGAGFKRNAEMAALGADVCIAFPGGNGTADMCSRAAASGILVIEPGKNPGE